MRRLRFRTQAQEVVHRPPALAWAWADRLPQALREFAFVSEVRPGHAAGVYTLVLGPVGYGKVSMSLAMDMSVLKEPGRRLCLQSLPGTGNADALVTVEVAPGQQGNECVLTISLDVSPHKPAGSFWPRELIEKASAASLHVAARKMLKDMKAAIEGGAADRLVSRLKATSTPAEEAPSAMPFDLPH